MKTAISVPDDVYERAERFARRERRSRSEVLSSAASTSSSVATDERLTSTHRAARDISDPEPLPPDHLLWGLLNALISPHVLGDSAARRSAQ